MIDRSPFAGLKLPKPPQKTIPIFTEAQIEAMLKAIDTSTHEGFRNSLLVQLYLDTGCRLSEVTNLRPDDIDWQMRTIKVLGKGKKERVVPMGSKVTKLLWQYIEKHRAQPAIPEYDHVFLTRYGDPLTNRCVERIFKKIGKKAGITGVRVSPHTARHTFCSMWFKNGGDTFSCQRITGHTSLEVLQGYVHLDSDDICQAHSECSPMDHLGKPKRKR
jgi:integrase/recombinase XerD